MLTTQSQNCYREQIQKEMLTRLAWKSRYAHRYPSCRPPPAPSPGPPPAPGLSLEGDGRLRGKGRRLYLQRRGHVRPEEKFDFPLLSSWEYGWRLGELEARTPSRAKSSVVKNTFYARNGVFSSPSATDALG
uniref:Si:ch211-193l2.10 n=1 Tax=Cyclopterus lumpus TaxID=8103 RepID=A0A8C2YXE4_CYCLU